MSEVDPGEGWRLLRVGERIEAGDEWESVLDGIWRACGPEMPGYPIGHDRCRFRRRVPASTADAPTPEPLAWGVQIESKRGLWGHYDYESEARAVCEAVNREEGGRMTVVPLYAAPPAPHPWCRDVARDLAARGSERRDDTVMHRDVPDAIHRLNGLVAGLAERMAEIERRHNGDAPAAEPSDDAVALGRALCDLRDTRESLAVAHRGIDRITAERDAAIRERDEARADRAELTRTVDCDQARFATEIGRLKARIAMWEGKNWEGSGT